MQGIGRDTVVDGRYRVEQRLGSGGMADVWRAEDEQLGRRVALKLLAGRYAEDEAFRERFRREASAAAGLQHPNVVNIFDRGDWDGTPYIAMECVVGPTLKQIVRENGPLDAGRATDIVEAILRALRYAHKRGIVHRDIKPQNVLIDEEGQVKVADFGIARAGGSELTETGSIVGTAQYISPEQAQGKPVSPRSDLYSVGIVLYELLTGRVPFEAESPVSVALKQVSEAPVPPSQLQPGVPPALEGVVLRALEKDPERRFADADEFIAALERARRAPRAAVTLEPTPGEPWAAVEEEQRRARRWWLWLLVLLALAAIGVGAYLLLTPKKLTVPNVIRLKSATAAQILHNRGFEVKIDRVVNASVPRDTVATQDPQPGAREREGTTVSITVSSGPGEAPVPAVEGLDRDQAVREVQAAGFKARVRKQSSDTVPAGQVIRAEPTEGTLLEKGQTVTLLVSKGKERVTVPGVVGLDNAAAERQLQSAGLQVAVVSQVSQDQQPGTVLAQDPAQGAKAVKGTTVRLTVAQAPPKIEIPDVGGKSAAAARSELTGAGFEVRVRRRPVTDPTDVGKVVAQSPDAGERRTKGATVTITVGEAPAATPTPSPSPSPVPTTTPTPAPTT